MEKIDRRCIDGGEIFLRGVAKLDEIVDWINANDAPAPVLRGDIDVFEISEETGKKYYCRTFEDMNIYFRKHCLKGEFTIHPVKMTQGEYEKLPKADHGHL